MNKSRAVWMRQYRHRQGENYWARRLRKEVEELLGSQCAICGFSDRRALEIDHINAGGRTERNKYGAPSKYQRHIIAVEGKGYQLLCANCNRIKQAERNERRVFQEP